MVPVGDRRGDPCGVGLLQGCGHQKLGGQDCGAPRTLTSDFRPQSGREHVPMVVKSPGSWSLFRMAPGSQGGNLTALTSGPWWALLEAGTGPALGGGLNPGCPGETAHAWDAPRLRDPEAQWPELLHGGAAWLETDQAKEAATDPPPQTPASPPRRPWPQSMRSHSLR